MLLVLLLGPLRQTISQIIAGPPDPLTYSVVVADWPDGANSSTVDLSPLNDGSAQAGARIPWSPSYEVSDAVLCRPGVDSWVMRLELVGQQSPARLRLFVSQDPAQEGQTSDIWPGPATVALTGAGNCRVVELPVQEGWVDEDIDDLVGGERWIEVRIGRRYEDPNIRANDTVVIGEIELID